MGDDKLPWAKWFWGDWLSALDLRQCSPRADPRRHGGAAGSGAPRGERNGNFRTGRYTEETQALLRAARLLMRGARRTVKAS